MLNLHENNIALKEDDFLKEAIHHSSFGPF